MLCGRSRVSYDSEALLALDSRSVTNGEIEHYDGKE
jgi:hypothetical protein